MFHNPKTTKQFTLSSGNKGPEDSAEVKRAKL